MLEGNVKYYPQVSEVAIAAIKIFVSLQGLTIKPYCLLYTNSSWFQSVINVDVMRVQWTEYI